MSAVSVATNAVAAGLTRLSVIIFGASGMVGQSVMRECLLDPQVERVLSVVRKPLPPTSTDAAEPSTAKVTELVHTDMYDYSSVDTQLRGYDACFFCIGVSSVGMKEEEYRRVTYDLTMASARAVLQQNQNMVFVYVTGMGSDTSENPNSWTMWPRIKGKTENDLMKLGFKGAYMFRPGYIHPTTKIRSKTVVYQTLIPIVSAFYPVLNYLAPKSVTTTEKVGKAMINAGKFGAGNHICEVQQINELAALTPTTAATSPLTSPITATPVTTTTASATAANTATK